MPGRGKPLHQCTVREIRALLTASTLISLGIVAVSFRSGQPAWFLWTARGFLAVYLGVLWVGALRELRRRKDAETRPVSDGRGC